MVIGKALTKADYSANPLLSSLRARLSVRFFLSESVLRAQRGDYNCLQRGSKKRGQV